MAGRKVKKKSKTNALKQYQGNKSYVKGLLFEKTLEKLLIKSGFSTEVSGLQITKNQKRLHGRGATYDPDFFKQFSLGIPFVNPLMLILEAKYYNTRVDIRTVREFLGAYIDISQYAHIDTTKGGQKRYNMLFDIRYSYCPVLFSLKGFQKKSEGFMFAHGINFISYENSEIMAKILKFLEGVLEKMDFSKFKDEDFSQFGTLEIVKNIRPELKKAGFDGSYEEFLAYLNTVNSLIGVLDYKYPIHILYERGISASYSRDVCIVQKKENLFILENTVKRKFGEFSFSRNFLKKYAQYAQKKGTLDKILMQIDIVQVSKDSIILRKLKINSKSKQDLINQLLKTQLED